MADANLICVSLERDKQKTDFTDFTEARNVKDPAGISKQVSK